MTSTSQNHESGVPLISLDGTFREMGEQHGEEFRDEIQQIAESRLSYLTRLVLEEAKSWEGREPFLKNSRARYASANTQLSHLGTATSASEVLEHFAIAPIIQTGDGDADRSGAIFLLNPKESEISVIVNPSVPNRSNLLHVRM
jgi:hypothetical protein